MSLQSCIYEGRVRHRRYKTVDHRFVYPLFMIYVDLAELSDQVTLLKQDYRDLDGQYDKLASIEMIEAVGHKYLDQYLEQCARLLRPDGSLVLQAIVMPERGYDRYRTSVDFIQRYIFPGGCLPSLGAILDSVGRSSDMRLIQAEDFAPHYAETLRRWRKSFQENLSTILQMGYSQEFVRMWNYYLCYCEAAFQENHISVMQIQFGKPECRLDPARLSNQNSIRSTKSEPFPISELTACHPLIEREAAEVCV